MKLLALICVVLWVLAAIGFKAADRPGDDFGIGVIFWLEVLAASACTLILAIWAAVRYWGWA